MSKKFIAIWVFLLLIISACGKQKEAFVDIGYVGPLTGAKRELGVEAKRTLELTIDQINSEGGVGGEMLRLVTVDNNCSTKSPLEDLLIDGKLSVLIGGICTGAVSDVVKFANENKIPLLVPALSEKDVDDGGDYVFRIGHSLVLEGEMSAKAMWDEIGVRKIGLMTENTKKAQDLANIFRDEFKKLGGEIVAEEVFSKNEQDFQKLIIKMRQSRPAAVYVAVDNSASGEKLITQLHKQEFTKPILADYQVVYDGVEKGAGLDTSDVIYYSPSYDASNPAMVRLMSHYEESYQEVPKYPFLIAATFDSLRMAVDAISEVGSNSNKIRDYLASIDERTGLLGQYKIDDQGNSSIGFEMMVTAPGGSMSYKKYLEKIMTPDAIEVE